MSFRNNQIASWILGSKREYSTSQGWRERQEPNHRGFCRSWVFILMLFTQSEKIIKDFSVAKCGHIINSPQKNDSKRP